MRMRYSREEVLTDQEIVKAIHQMIDGVEWNSDTLSDVAELLSRNGYEVRSPQVEG